MYDNLKVDLVGRTKYPLQGATLILYLKGNDYLSRTKRMEKSGRKLQTWTIMEIAKFSKSGEEQI